MNQPPYNNQQPLQYPNEYPPLPGQFFGPPASQPPSPRRYSTPVLRMLCIAYALGWILSLLGVAAQGQTNFLLNLGVSLFFGILVCLLILDARGTVSLQGLIRWHRMKAGRRILVGFLCFLVFPFLLAVYFVRTIRLQQRTPQAIRSGSVAPHSKRPVAALVAGILVTLFALIFANAGGATSAQQPGQSARMGSRVFSSPTATTVVQSSYVTATTSSDTPTVIPTKASTVLPTQVPTSTPTSEPQPTQVPTQPIKPSPAPSLTLVFTGASAVDYAQGYVSVHTLPGASLTITVTYCSGYEAVSSSLKGTSYADGSGNHTWTWTPQTKCHGTATADVIATDNGQSAEQTDSFTVQ